MRDELDMVGLKLDCVQLAGSTILNTERITADASSSYDVAS